MTDQEATHLCQQAACPDSHRVDHEPYSVELGAWGFIVTDRATGYALSGAVHMARFKAEAECAEANASALNQGGTA